MKFQRTSTLHECFRKNIFEKKEVSIVRFLDTPSFPKNYWIICGGTRFSRTQATNTSDTLAVRNGLWKIGTTTSDDTTYTKFASSKIPVAFSIVRINASFKIQSIIYQD
jgi:hypothetical protein